MNNTIPKIIHYCWFGRNALPDKEKRCIESWKKLLPDYKLMLWSEETFDIQSNIWTKSAYSENKYAFVSDYVRLWALHNYGGIYLDTDVKVLKNFDDLLEHKFFACFEDVAGTSVATCVIGAEKSHPVIIDMLRYYDRKFDMSIVENNIANVVYLTNTLEKQGLVKNGKYQVLSTGAVIYPRTYFCPMDYFGNWDLSKNTYSIHYFSGSWLPEEEYLKHKRRNGFVFILLKKLYGKLKCIKIIRDFREKIKNI